MRYHSIRFNMRDKRFLTVQEHMISGRQRLAWPLLTKLIRECLAENKRFNRIAQ